MALCSLHFKCTTSGVCSLSEAAFSFHREHQQTCLIHCKDFVSLQLCGPPPVCVAAFSYTLPAAFLHHRSVLISSSIREHGLILSLLTYSSEPTSLFEQQCADGQSKYGLSCYIMSAGKKGNLMYTWCNAIATKLKNPRFFGISYLSLLISVFYGNIRY